MLTFISRNITPEKVANVQVFLDQDMELVPLQFSVACLLTQRTQRRPIPNCPRNHLIEGCREYNATIRLLFYDESTLEMSHNFTTFPGIIFKE